jgi:tether containing UBX domain for GLUT4
VSLLLHHENFSNKRPLDSHVPAPLSPEVISQAVDLPPPPPPVVLDASIDVEGIPSIGTKSVESKLPKWLKLAQSE